MYVDYVACVRAEYDKKRANRGFPYDLMNPTPANVRDACVRVCRDRYELRDVGFIEAFFKVKGEKGMVCKAIENFEIDKFRPLIKYLRNEVDEPGTKNVELLAWLIDFQDRPFQPEKKYTLPETGKVDEPEESDVSTIPTKEEALSENDNGSNKEKIKGNVLAGGLVAAVVGLCVYALYPNTPATPKKEIPAIIPLLGQHCMYWSGERFDQISCIKENVSDTIQIVGFDSTLFVQLRRITKLDTITLKSIGYVWYLKRDNKLEYFTAGGVHPIHRSKLHPITAYIIRKYLPGNL